VHSWKTTPLCEN